MRNVASVVACVIKSLFPNTVGPIARKGILKRTFLKIEPLESRILLANSWNITVGILGIDDTLQYGQAGVPDTVQKANGDAQIAATIASWTNQGNPIKAGATFSIAGGALATATAATAADLQQGNYLNAAGDVISGFGDLGNMGGAILAQIPGPEAEYFATRLEYYSNFLTVAGILVNHAGPISAQLISEANQEDAFLEGQATGPAPSSTPLGKAMGAISYELANDSNALGQAIKDVGNSSFSADMTVLLNAFDDAKSSFASLLINSGAVAPNVTDTVTGNTSSLSSSDASLNGTTGTLAGTLNGNSFPLDTTANNNGSSIQTGAVVTGDTGTIVSKNLSNGTTAVYLYNPPTDISPGTATPGTNGYAGYTATFYDSNDQLVHTATILYQSQDGNYVINGATESNTAMQYMAPVALDNTTTILSITPPAQPTTSNVTIQSTTDNSIGNLTTTTVGIVGSNIGYTEAINTNSTGAATAMIAGQGDQATLTNASITLAQGSISTIDGDGNNVAAGSGSSVTANGSGNTINGPAGISVTVGPDGQNGVENVVNVSGGQVAVTSGGQADVNGDNNSVSAATNSLVTVNGSGDTLATPNGTPATTSTMDPLAIACPWIAPCLSDGLGQRGGHSQKCQIC